jgi:hypothetical protein
MLLYDKDLMFTDKEDLGIILENVPDLMIIIKWQLWPEDLLAEDLSESWDKKPPALLGPR